MIRVENLSKSYGELKAVDGVSFDIQDGELFGFLGPNGAGKTTTLSMISGLLKPDSGTVWMHEINVWETPIPAKRMMGLVPQELAIYEELTAQENLEFWGSLYNLSRSQLKSNITDILEKVGLTDRAKEAVSRFSGGMKRRLNLAIGLVHQPKIVLMDEPTVGIDPQARNNILDIIREIAKAGTTILFTTHHLEEAESLCERIAIMDHGQILDVGTVQELAQITGDGDVVTLSGTFTSSTLKSALSSDHIDFINVSDGVATFNLKNNHFGIAQVIQALSEAKIEIQDISIQKPSLESVFLKLTGRELRD